MPDIAVCTFYPSLLEPEGSGSVSSRQSGPHSKNLVTVSKTKKDKVKMVNSIISRSICFKKRRRKQQKENRNH